jgi:hypothetical protein
VVLPYPALELIESVAKLKMFRPLFLTRSIGKRRNDGIDTLLIVAGHLLIIPDRNHFVVVALVNRRPLEVWRRRRSTS